MTHDSPASGADYVHTYAFDDAGNRESWLKDTDPAFGSTGTGHLTFDVQSFAEEVTVTYAYDDNDRLLTETLDASGAADDRHTVYDWAGGSTMQLGKVVYDTLDDTGDVVREESFTYTSRGRLAGAAIDADGAGSSSAAETTTEYSYDDSGFRIRQSTTHDSTTVVTEFVADANNPTGYTQTIEEHVDGELLRSYTFGLDEIVQAVKDNPAASAVVSQFLHDGRGSVRQLADALAELVQAATKDAAAVLKLDYTAYGTAVNYAAETVATALLHNGEFVDPVTGQQYLRARWYDQASGRFNRVDPFAGEASIPQSLHKYLFAHGDPNTHADPSGEFLWLVPVAAFGVTALYGSLKGWGLSQILAYSALSALIATGIGAAFGAASLGLAATGVPLSVANTAVVLMTSPTLLGLAALNLQSAYERKDPVDIAFGWFEVVLSGGGLALAAGAAIAFGSAEARTSGIIASAIREQTKKGFLADAWSAGVSRKGSLYLASVPEESAGGRIPNFFTTQDVLAGSRLDSRVIAGRLQTGIDQEHGPRKWLGVYEQVVDSDVAWGTVKANIVDGPGGAPQVYFKQPEATLRLVRRIPLQY